MQLFAWLVCWFWWYWAMFPYIWNLKKKNHYCRVLCLLWTRVYKFLHWFSVSHFHSKDQMFTQLSCLTFQFFDGAITHLAKIVCCWVRMCRRIWAKKVENDLAINWDDLRIGMYLFNWGSVARLQTVSYL